MPCDKGTHKCWVWDKCIIVLVIVASDKIPTMRKFPPQLNLDFLTKCCRKWCHPCQEITPRSNYDVMTMSHVTRQPRIVVRPIRRLLSIELTNRKPADTFFLSAYDRKFTFYVRLSMQLLIFRGVLGKRTELKILWCYTAFRIWFGEREKFASRLLLPRTWTKMDYLYYSMKKPYTVSVP